jgi:hypothetical protein
VAVALALTVRLSRAAAAQLDALHRRARGMLAIEDRDVLLVYAVAPWGDLERLVLGPELDRRHREREALALMHGRR